MTSTAKSWRQRRDAAAEPRYVVLEQAFAGLAAGTRMFVPTPRIVEDYVRGLPPGRTRSFAQMRDDIAQAHGCSACCPLTSALHLRVVAEVAWDELVAGQSPASVAPFWRVVAPGSPVARRLRSGDAWLQAQRDAEAATS